MTIEASEAMLQYLEIPDPGTPRKRVFVPHAGTVDPAKVSPRFKRWNLKVHPEGTIDSFAGARAWILTTKPNAPSDVEHVIVGVIKAQPELQGLRPEDFHVWIAHADPSWALASFDGVDAQGHEIPGVDLMHRKALGWRVAQGPGTSLDYCHVPAAVRHEWDAPCY
jgi:hypothetical protein